VKLGQASALSARVRAVPYPREATLHGLFSEHAAATPDKAAVVMDDIVLSYGDLERRSNALARRLRGRGVGEGDRVGLLSHRAPEAITAILASLKLGAFFMPLDPAYPPERVRMMVEDARPAVVLAQAAALADHPSIEGYDGLLLSLEAEIDKALRLEDASALPAAGAAGEPAYLIYTSGSTGRPKGVLGVHRGVVRAVWRNELAGFDADAVTLHVTAPSFDPSQLEIWGALANGGTIAILPDPTPALDRIAWAIGRYGATWTSLTTGLFHLMVDHKLEALAPLRCIFAGGDVLSPPHANKAVATLTSTRVVNAYGPTENGIVTTWFEVPRDGWPERSIPIGFAVPETQVHVLDEALQPVADGEVGQLCTGGDGLAAGYFGRPDLTAERFVPDPFAASPDARMYLTGDLVRRRPDGAIEFVGRNDRQVKINNKRVELDEIENIVREDPRLADAIVILREDEPGAPRLAAYLKPAEPIEAEARSAFADAVAESLREKLPTHMQPADLVVMDAFPLTEAGKVDRKALPRPAVRATAPNGDSAGPVMAASETEQAIAEIWAEVLKLPAVGVDDNFFDLGGTSMQLVRVHAQIQGRLASDVTLVTLFELPKIRDLAAHLARPPGVAETGTGVASRERADKRAEALARARNLKARAGR
jgi:amino acid adenylation domain-containing protein